MGKRGEELVIGGEGRDKGPKAQKDIVPRFRISTRTQSPLLTRHLPFFPSSVPSQVSVAAKTSLWSFSTTKATRVIRIFINTDFSRRFVDRLATKRHPISDSLVHRHFH
jgi:hypothetical protein